MAVDIRLVNAVDDDNDFKVQGPLLLLLYVLHIVRRLQRRAIDTVAKRDVVMVTTSLLILQSSMQLAKN